MTDWIGIAAVISAVAAAVVSIITALRVHDVSVAVSDVKTDIKEVKTNTNSLTERLELNATLAGQLKERDNERNRADTKEAAGLVAKPAVSSSTDQVIKTQTVETQIVGDKKTVK